MLIGNMKLKKYKLIIVIYIFPQRIKGKMQDRLSKIRSKIVALHYFIKYPDEIFS